MHRVGIDRRAVYETSFVSAKDASELGGCKQFVKYWIIASRRAHPIGHSARACLPEQAPSSPREIKTSE